MKQLPRDQIQLATKFGIVGFDSNGVVVNGTPEYVRSCCDASLKRLGVDYIDLYYQHRVDTSIPIEDTVSVNPFSLNKIYLKLKISYFITISTCYCGIRVDGGTEEAGG